MIDQVFNAGGEINDTRDVKLGMTAASAFAYLADGTGGMRIVQLFAPNDNPNYLGFSPKPTPKLIATYQDARARRWLFPRASIATAPWMKAGIRLTVFNRRGVASVQQAGNGDDVPAQRREALHRDERAPGTGPPLKSG